MISSEQSVGGLGKMVKAIKKIVVCLVAISLQALLILDVVLIFYFNQHFMWGTTINGKDVSGWTVEEVKASLEAGGENYYLQLNERFDKSEEIRGEEIDYHYEVASDIEELKKRQCSISWELMRWMDRRFEVAIVSKYDQAALKERCERLDCTNESKMIRPEDAFIRYQNNKYEVIKGAQGTALDKQILEVGIKEAIEAEKESLDLESLGCYKEAEVQENETTLVCTAHRLNDFLEKHITYEFGDQEEIITSDKLRNWLCLANKENNGEISKLPNTLNLSILEQKEIVLNEEAIYSYVEQLAEKYDTLHKTRTFTTSKGVSVEVPSGDYGWQIDGEQETKELIGLLKSNVVECTRTPIYKHEAYCRDSNDIGNTYVEVDLTHQHLWFYKNGQLVTEGDIVSGTGTNKHATPAGVFSIDYKKRNAILRGPGYACPVSYWMPFYDGMGIHDATWRERFGGTIYMYDGSHGCINSPLSLASKIYDEMESGVPIVCYH